MQPLRITLISIAGIVLATCAAVAADHQSLIDNRQSELPSAARGYHLLTTKAYLPPDFDQQIFDQLWQTWEPRLRERARAAKLDERRAMTMARYGLTGPPEGAVHTPTPGGSPVEQPTSDLRPPTSPVQYVVDAQGRWTMNCLSCHQGRIAGRTIPGVPNTMFALATLTEEVRATKMRLEQPLSRMDVASLFMPLGNTQGTTNAVMFGVILMNYRDADLSIHPDRPRPPMVHHDLDAPAWWHVHEKQRLYYDGFVPKNHRALMQFLMVRENGPEKFREWEPDYRDLMAWIDELRPPKYPFAIDRPLAHEGQAIFNQRCATCHGTYDSDGVSQVVNYPNRVVSLSKLGTDPVRLTALTSTHRRAYAASWFNDFGRHEVDAEPTGYVAPPLTGIWATAPYLHNGSVPTLWHLFHAADRPTVWHRVPEGRETELEGFDQERGGFKVESLAEVPAAASSLHQRRQYYDTRASGHSAAGHLFPDQLKEPEKRAVLEYLKTL
ncbi:MAG: cytochrome c [Planctomycetia bacterium]|nr:cytochrome c [Planctomycetia bacterium]